MQPSTHYAYQTSTERQFVTTSNEVRIVALNATHEAEVLSFLAVRPIHTVAMVGLIHDNGLISALNRGAFYGCYSRRGQLEGVGLIGHSTLIETTSDRALECLAAKAHEQANGHLIMGESDRIREFWRYYAPTNQAVRRACREVLFELNSPTVAPKGIQGLRLATREDLDSIAPIHAQMAQDESGVDPRMQDAIGFRRRCARRIDLGRSWVATENGRLIFKADIVSLTPSVIYLEGIWSHSECRAQGSSVLLMSSLVRLLLSRTESLCLLVNERNIRAQRFYQRIGFKRRAIYDTIFLC